MTITNHEKLKLFIILPAFNEEKVIAKVLTDLRNELSKFTNFISEIVLVDDGSGDKTGSIARQKKATVLRHPINRGLGGALSTGLEYAKINNADITVSFDADGQHDARDINKLIQPVLTNKADVVIGIRYIKSMPWDRRLLTIGSSIITFIFFGIYCKDTQSGFRVFNKKALDLICFKTQRMEVSSELFGEIKKYKLRLSEVPIRVIYTAYSRKKGQPNLNSIKILLKLILRLFR